MIKQRVMKETAPLSYCPMTSAQHQCLASAAAHTACRTGSLPMENVQEAPMVQQAVLKAQEAAAGAYFGQKLQLLTSSMCYNFP